MKSRSIFAAAASLAIVVSACSSGASTAPSSTAATSAPPTTAASAPAASSAASPVTVGEGEGALNLIAWAGYVVGEIGRASCRERVSVVV